MITGECYTLLSDCPGKKSQIVKGTSMHMNVVFALLVMVTALYLFISVVGVTCTRTEYNIAIIKRWRMHLIYSSFWFFFALLVAILFA